MSYRPRSSRATAVSIAHYSRAVALATGFAFFITAGPSAARVQREIRQINPAAARAQLGLRQIAPATGEEKDAGVFVRDSGVAVEKIALAERMERLHEWNKSADVYQEILEKFSDRVLPSKINADGKVEQYASVALVVQEKLARWPEEGLAVYRGRYEESARQLVETDSTDRTALAKVFSNYFVTESAKLAGRRLMSLYLVNGEFTAAAWTGERLLALHPTLAAERPAVLYQTAIALHLSNNDARAEEKLAELNAKFADATGTVRGEDVVFAESLANELKTEAGVTRVSSADSWPTAFGGPERSAVPPTAVNGGAPLFGIDLKSDFKPRGIGARMLKQFEAMNASGVRSGMNTGIFPVIDHGELFFTDNARVFAVNLDTGRPLTGWSATYPGDRRGAFSIDAWPRPRQRQLTLTVTDSRVLGVLGQADSLSMNMGGFNGAGPATQLVCLDRASGKKQWAVQPRLMNVPDTAAALREAQFFGTPLVIGDTVFITARTSKPGQIEDCHVVALGLTDGAFQWSSYIASASANMYDAQVDEGYAGPASTSHLAFADGRVFVQTNVGAVASIDATDGKILWLSLYPRNESDGTVGVPVNNRFRRQNGRQRGFTYNPPMLVGGRLFALPSDSPNVLVFDSGTGQLIKKIGREFQPPAAPVEGQKQASILQRMDTLVGVIGSRLVLSGEDMIYCIDWSKFDPSGPRNAWLKWNSSSLVGVDGAPAILGRPFLTGDAVLVTTATALYRIDVQRGGVVSIFPATGQWEEGQGPGNVLATPEYLVIAGPSDLNVYTDLSLARKKLETEITNAPASAEPRLKYAEMMFAAAAHAEALTHLDEAIDVMGGRATLAIGPARDRLFEDALSFANKLVTKGTTSMADELFDRARDAALSPLQQTRYRLDRAKAARARQDYKAELALFQQILAEPTWRATQPFGSATGGLLAEQGIAAIVKERGPDAYAAFNQQAMVALEAAKKQEGTVALVEVADAFPNSNAVAAALDVAAQRYETAADHRGAARLLRRLYSELTTNESRLKALEGLARNYVTLPGGEAIAMARLMQASKLAPQGRLAGSLKLADGRVVDNTSFRAAAELLKLNQSKQAADALPTIGFAHAPPPVMEKGKKPAPLPPSVVLGLTIDRVSKIVKPMADHARHDRVVTWHPSTGLTVYAAGAQEPRARIPEFSEAPLLCAWAGDKLAVVGQTSVVLLDDATGKKVWEGSTNGLAASDAVAAADDAPVADAGDEDESDDFNRQRQMMAQQQIRFAVNGRLARVEGNDPAMVDADGDGLPDGAGVAGPGNGSDVIVRAKLLNDRLVVCTAASRVASFNLTDGKPGWATRVSNDTPRHFMASDDFVVVTTYDEQQLATVTVLDAATGRVSTRPKTNGDPNNQLVNAALSADGTLVLAVSNSLIAYDLYDPSGKELWTSKLLPQFDFRGATGREQLVIHNGRVLIVMNAQLGNQSVRSFELSNGDRSRAMTADKNWNEVAFNVPMPVPGLPAARMNPQLPIFIRAAGDRVYLYNQKYYVSYDLNCIHESVQRANQPETTVDVFLGSDHIVLVDTPRNVNGDRTPSIKLNAYSREMQKDGAEAGVLDQWPTISDPAQIQVGNWQPVDGGIYYVSGDQKLKFLKTFKPVS